MQSLICISHEHVTNDLIMSLPSYFKYEQTVECFKLLNRSQFVTSSAISSFVS